MNKQFFIHGYMLIGGSVCFLAVRCMEKALEYRVSWLFFLIPLIIGFALIWYSNIDPNLDNMVTKKSRGKTK